TDEPEINDVFEKVNKRIKTQEIENNKIFSKLSDNEKEIVVNTRNELEKISFLQIRALHVALILCKNIFLTVNIEIITSTGKAALELKSSGKTCRTIHSVFKFGKNISPNKIKWKLRDKGYCDWLRKVRAIIIDKCSMINDDLLDYIVHLFTR
ncbi:11824_t:CDS:2, partial [Racocetra persica]